MTISTPESAKSAPSPPPTERRGLPILKLSLVVAALLLTLVAILGGVAWYFSSQLLDVRPDGPSYNLKVLALSRTTIKLPRTGSTQRPGVYGIDWPGGRITLGSVVSMTPQTVTRHFTGSVGNLRVGQFVDFDVPVYASPAGIHANYRTVRVADAMGPMPAWYIPGRLHTWAILVHGYKANRTDPLRVAPTLTAIGLPVLDISYRNDIGAPASPDHLYHLGATEWQDVEAGVRYAMAHGAHSVVLYGFSMGGGIVESFLYRSHDAGRVRAVVLDAPALDWGATIDLAASQRSLPSFLATVTERVVAWRLGLWDLGAINAVSESSHLHTPTLLFHGTDDHLVPIGPSIALARARPDLVTFVQVTGAAHTESWNVAPGRYSATLKAFLTRVLGK